MEMEEWSTEHQWCIKLLPTWNGNEGCSITHNDRVLHKHAVRITLIHWHHVHFRHQLPQHLKA